MARVINIVKKNLYRDSVQLLNISENIRRIDGVINAFIAMATRLNKELMSREGMLAEEGLGAGENDLIIALKLGEGADLDRILMTVEEMLSRGAEGGLEAYDDIDVALSVARDINLALVSIPGQYAREVVEKLLDRGIHVHLFSDHVPIEDEVAMKKKAVEKGLLLMGPEAGTSIIGGLAIAFANKVREGPVGIVSASGSGLQEVSAILSNIGVGVSHGIGVGGRDLSERVGGIMTLFSIEVLERDPATGVVVVISKPTSRDVVRRVVERIRAGGKGYVTCFIGGEILDIGENRRGRVIQTRTLHGAALEAARLAKPQLYWEARRMLGIDEGVLKKIEEGISRLREGQRYIRGLYVGGTLAYEAMYILKSYVGDIYSNTPLEEEYRLDNPWTSRENTIVDLGGGEFTEGRPHPMIDPSIRVSRIAEEARDPEVAVIMLDFILGYGSHSDPVGAHLEALRRAIESSRSSGRELIVLAHIIGTEGDPQNMPLQREALEKLGVVVLPTNAMMALAAAMITMGRADRGFIEEFEKKYLVGL